jgi:ABC-2 type transport system permease protein
MLRRIWAITQKEFIQLIRNRLVLPALVIGPLLELILFAVAIHTDVRHIPMVVADQSLSAASQSYLNAFTDSGSFDIVATVPDQTGVIHAIDSGQANIGVVIPPDFASRVEQKDANVLMLVDGSNSFVTQSASSSAAAISEQYAIRFTRQQVGPLNAHIQILYNPDLQDLWYVVPAFGAFLLYGLALKLTAFAIVREREVGTIEALLVTPIRPIELMLGKTIPNLCVGIVNTATILPVGVSMFRVPFRGNLLLFSALSILFAVCGLGLGMAISAISQTQIQANQVSSLMNIAAMFLSGFMFPAYALPLFLRLLGYVLPLTFFMPIVNGVFIKGVGLDYLWVPVLSLTALTGAIFFIGARFFRQKLD